MTRTSGGLTCADLTVVVGAVTVLDGVDIAVPAGATVALLGPSGAGKSTAIRAIAGFAPLERGSIVLDGESLDDVPPERRRIGTMFQRPRLFPALTVGSNVAFAPRVQGVAKREREALARSLLARVGLADRFGDSVQGLSGGEQQRVALARALAHRPRLLLMDEPFNAVDDRRREALRELVAEVLAEFAITSLLVTHDVADAHALATTAIGLEEGRIIQRGSVGAVVESFSHGRGGAQDRSDPDA